MHRLKSKVAIVFDWENWWAIEKSSGPTVALKYVDEIHKYYEAFFRRNIQVDMISVDTDLSRYDIVIAPVIYMVKPGLCRESWRSMLKQEAHSSRPSSAASSTRTIS